MRRSIHIRPKGYPRREKPPQAINNFTQWDYSWALSDGHYEAGCRIPWVFVWRPRMKKPLKQKTGHDDPEQSKRFLQAAMALFRELRCGGSPIISTS